MMECPEFPEGKILYETLYETDKSMNERINEMEDTVREFKEYIEMWIHQIKLPIAGLTLMNYNKNYDEDYNPKFRKQRKKVCVLCSDKNFELDYKNADQLKKFVNDKGKILPRRTTGCCAKHQRDITTAVKRARHIAVLPYAQQ